MATPLDALRDAARLIEQAAAGSANKTEEQLKEDLTKIEFWARRGLVSAIVMRRAPTQAMLRPPPGSLKSIEDT